MSAARLIRLRALVDRLERLPASREREWMLAEARARMVDVETGESPRAMRPLAPDPPARSLNGGKPQVRNADGPKPLEASAQLPQPSPSPRRGRAVDESGDGHAFVAGLAESTPLSGIDEVLWAEEPQEDASASGAGDDGDSRPWRRGLRG